jgi:hypothetical protein
MVMFPAMNAHCWGKPRDKILSGEKMLREEISCGILISWHGFFPYKTKRGIS